MTLAISQALATARLEGVRQFLDTGPDRARIRIYDGTRPASVDDPPSATLLVEIPLEKPCGTVSHGQLSLVPYEDGLILATGIATWSRIVNGEGIVAMDLDVSDTAGNGDLKLASTQLYAGGACRLVSAILI